MFVQEINKNESNKMDWIMGFISGVLISTVVDDTKIDGGGTHKEMETYLLAMNKKGKKELNDLRIKTRIRDLAKRILPRPRSKAELISLIEKWEKNPNAYQPLSAWDTSKITDMSRLFRFIHISDSFHFSFVFLSFVLSRFVPFSFILLFFFLLFFIFKERATFIIHIKDCSIDNHRSESTDWITLPH